MKIITSNEIGFCFGVKQALKIVKQKISTSKKPVRMYGFLIHNESVVKDLEELGIEIIKDVSNVKNGTLIITAHGIPPQVKQDLEKRKNLSVIDTTCPKVSAVHKIASNLSRQGRTVLIFGDSKHQEVIGIKGAAGDNAKVFSSLEELNKLNLSKDKKYGLVVQTTQDTKAFEKAQKELKRKLPGIKIINTICCTTYKRQSEIREIAKKTDIVLIIGSKTSANTRRLYEISSNINPDTYYIATAKELKKQWLVSKKKVGIGAGASTPDNIIEQVIEKINKISKND